MQLKREESNPECECAEYLDSTTVIYCKRTRKPCPFDGISSDGDYHYICEEMINALGGN